MALYKLTPYERRARAETIRKQRAAQYAARLMPTYQGTVKNTPEKDEADGLTKALHTTLDVGANVLTGVGKGIEGIVDFGAGLVGAVGGIFSDDFQDDMQDFIARDHTGELYGNAWQEALEHSALNDSKFGQIVEGVAQGVGQMLPAVAVSVATGGAAAPALFTTMVSAAGTGTEQAFQEGANYGQGMLYGTATGALEGVTEKLTGGFSRLYGGGWLDDVVKAGVKGVGKEAAEEVAEVGIKRIVKDMIGEGAEEVIAELANPLAKTIYKGKDALSEYGEGEYWQGVVDAGIIGAGTSLAYGGTVGHVTKQSGVYADANSVAEHVDEQRKKRANPNLTQAERVQIEKNIKKDNEVLSKQLQKLSDKSRARVMKARPELSAVFEADGTIKAEQLAALDANIEAAADTTYDARYRSSTLGKATIEKVLANGSTSTEKAVAFSGELDAEGQASLAHLQEMAGAVAYRSGDTARFLVAENVPEGRSYYDVDNKVAVISVEDLKKGNASSAFVRDIVADTYFGDVIHEVGHGIEGTHSGEMLDRHLKSNESVYNLAIEDMFKRGYMSEFYKNFDDAKADVQRIVSKVSEGDALTSFDQKVYDRFKSETFAFASQRVLGNEAFAKKLVQIDPSGVEKILAKVNELRENLKNRRSPEAKKNAEYLRTAEKLYLNAISEMGGTYKNGKIHLANREDEEGNAAQTVDESGEMRYNESEHFGNVKLARKVAKYIPYSKVGYNNISFIRQTLNKLYEGVEYGVADEIAIEKDDNIYVVDSGCENGDIAFGVRKIRTISNAPFRAQVVRRTNDDALSKGYVSDGLSSRVGIEYDNDSGRRVRRESGEELPVDTRKPKNYEGRVFSKDANRRGGLNQSTNISENSANGDSEARSGKNALYTATGEFYRDIAPVDRHAFARSLANKTSALADGEVKTVEIYCAKNVYWFQADGYMRGKVLGSVDSDDKSGYESARKEYENELKRNRETFDPWSASLSAERGRTKGDFSRSSERRGKMGTNGFPAGEQERLDTGDQGRGVSNPHHDQREIEELIAQANAYLASLPKKQVIDKPTEDLSTEEMIKRLVEQLKNQDQDNQVKRSRDVSEDAVELTQGELEALRGDNTQDARSKTSADKSAPSFNEHSVLVALYDALDHKDEGYDNLIRVSRMPEYVVENFGIDGEFYLYRDHSYENMATLEQAVAEGRPIKRNNKKVHFHGLGIETMTDAILSLNEPIMVIDDTKSNSNPTVVMMLPVFGSNGAPLYAALSFYDKSPINGDFSRKPHIVLTITPHDWFGTPNRDGWSERIDKAIQEKRVIDYNKNKRTDLSVIAQHTRLGNITDSSLNDSLSNFRKKVNTFREKNKIFYSRNVSDEKITISKDELEALRKDRGADKRPTSRHDAVSSLAKEYKQYSQKEVKGLVGGLLSDVLVFEKGKATFERKADIEQEVKRLLDTVSLGKTPEDAIGKIADYILEKAHIKGVYADASDEIVRHQRTVESFSKYLRSLDLTPIMGDLTKQDGRMSGEYYRWGNREGNEIITLEELKAELLEQGYGVKNKTPKQVFFMMDNAYRTADRALKRHEKEHGSLKAVLPQEEYTKAREAIIERITELYSTGGRYSEGMRVIAEREKQLAEREVRAEEKIKDARRQVRDEAKETLYSQDEARAVVDKILSEVLVFSGMRGVLRHGTYTSSIQKAFAMLNGAEDGKRWNAAYEVAAFIMKRASLVDTVDAVEVKPYLDLLEVFKPYVKGVDLSAAKKELFRLTGSDEAFRRWHKSKEKGGVSIDEFFDKLREKGYDLDSDAARAIALIDEEYSGVKEVLSEKVELSLEEVFLGDEAEKLKREIAKVVFNSFDESKSFSYANLQKVARSFAAKLERVTAESRKLRREKLFYEQEYEKYYKGFMKERELNEHMRGFANATRKTVELVKDIRNWKKGNFQSASKHRNSNFEETIGAFARLAINGQLNLSGGRKIFQQALSWYTEENEIFSGYFDSGIVEKMKAIAEGKGVYTATEVKQMGDVLQHFKKIVNEYGKIFRRGKRIEARPEAERYQGYIEADEGLNTSFTLHRNKFFREIAEPLSLAMSADKHRADGFFTETIQELRQGLIKKETLEMDFRRAIDDFMTHQGRRYQKSLNKETVEVGGIKIPKNNALLLYMTTKDADAHAALNVGGFTVADGAKKQLHDKDTNKALSADGLILERIMADEEVTLEEATAAVLALRSELYGQFSEADKELIRIAEAFFNKDGRKVKHDTDIQVKGYSNVKEGYYVPLNHDGRAEEIGLESAREGVLTYRFNKSRVKGAKGRLVIRPLTDVLFEQMTDIATYAGLSVPIENFNRLYNLSTSDNRYKPKTIKTMLAQDKRLWSEGMQYFQKIINGIEGGGESLGIISKAIGFLRGGLVRTWLSVNPKVLATQVSALAASFSKLNPKYVGQGLFVGLGKEGVAEMDKYCRLAELRNQDNSAALAQGVLDDINRFGDIGMKGIGWVDRLMITRLWNACRLQVQNEQGLAFESEENKIAAGKLLEAVILDTQQNSLITERSAMMRSSNELWKSFTMFTADAMKVMARFLGGFGRVSTLHRRIKLAKDQHAPADQIARLEQEMEMAKREFAGATAALLTSAVYMAAISLLFKALFGKLDDEDEAEDLALDFGTEVVGSILGGLPIIREIWDFMANGYEIDNYSMSAVNDILSGVKGVYSLADDVMNGRDVDKSEFGKKIKNLLYAVGQIFGVPLRNVHNILYGITKFIDAPTAYRWESAIYSQNYKSDLKKAIQAGDERMIAIIAELMVDESAGPMDAKVRDSLKGLVAKGYDVLPRSVGDSVTVDGETLELTGRQRKRFAEVYEIGDEAIADMVKLSQFKSADAAVQAKAVRFIYDVYWQLALQDLTGGDMAQKNVLFAEAIDIEKLAIIIATARSIEADKDRNGNAISGSKKRKIQAFINSLHLTAAQKYMIMGHLGYSNLNGEAAVKRYIGSLKLTKAEKASLLAYSGYAAA